MARVALPKPEQITDPAVEGIFAWVTEMEWSVPNHFYVELNFPEFFTAKLGATKVLWEMGELTMEEIQHVGILVSQANGCPYCTAAFCTILNYGLGTAEDCVGSLLQQGLDAVDEDRLKSLLAYELQVSSSATSSHAVPPTPPTKLQVFVHKDQSSPSVVPVVQTSPL